MKSVAILGFSPLTLPYMKGRKVDEYWTMNHAFLVTGIDHIDRLFEIHDREWYLRGEQTKSAKYKRWLKKKHPFPIYLQEKEVIPEVPSGVRYPFEEVCDTLLPGLIRLVGDDEVRMKYFTSSVAFMMALAIYEGFDQIELYGVDMDSDTEWGYQKPCGEFWMGYALGRGIKVIIPEVSQLCTAPVYGYEQVPYIDKVLVNKFIIKYQERHDEEKEKLEPIKQALNNDPENEKLVDEYLRITAWIYMYEGAITAMSRLINNVDGFVSRQYIDMGRYQYSQGMEFNKTEVNAIKGKIDAIGKDNVSQEDWTHYLNKRASMFANSGAMQIHNKFIKIIDYRPVDWELVQDIKED